MEKSKEKLIKLLVEIKMSQKVIDEILEMCNTEKLQMKAILNIEIFRKTGMLITEERILHIISSVKRAESKDNS